jgi:hypothetical protein
VSPRATRKQAGIIPGSLPNAEPRVAAPSRFVLSAVLHAVQPSIAIVCAIIPIIVTFFFRRLKVFG